MFWIRVNYFRKQVLSLATAGMILAILATTFLVSCNPGAESFEYEPGKWVTLSDNPRLFFPADKEKQILELAGSNPLLSDLVKVLRQQADGMLESPLQDEPVSLGISREQLSRMTTLATAYRLFKEDKYAERIENELRHVCSFDSWNPDHFLDVAEMTTAVAIAYDWTYDYLSDDTKEMVEQAILTKAFEPAWPVYRDGNENSWAKRNTNWNVVTNSGLVTGALAIAHKYPEEAAKIIQYAVEYTPNNISHFEPEGVYYEGPAYWGYTNMYLTLLLDNLERNLGNDYGLSSMTGVENTAQYYIHSLSPAHLEYNFANAGGIYRKANYTPIYFYYSKKFDQPEVAEFYRNYLQEALNGDIANGTFNFPRIFFLSIPWFDGTESNQQPEITENPRLQVFQGTPDILVFNGDSNGPDRMYLSAKGGRPDMAHNQLDVGSFVWDFHGVRWALDMGSDSYSLPGFWEYEPDGRRWDYIRNTNLGHNTLNIDGKIARSDGNGQLTRFDLKNSKPYGIYNMGSSYQEAGDVFRGFRMLASDVMMVRDEVHVREDAEEVNWRLLTEAGAEVVSEKLIKLTSADKEAYIYVPNAKSSVRIFDAKPNTPLERDTDGIRIVEISTKTEGKNRVDIPILLGGKVEVFENYLNDAALPLSSW
ncbi:MAG: DUF4962 domain-containing protein [Balneolales bacterium]